MRMNDAIKISKRYLQRLEDSEIGFSEVYLFGYYAKENQNEDSDVDIAIVLDDHINPCCETHVRLMVFRQGDETIIEPHAFSISEFNEDSPLVKQILNCGIKIEI